MTFPLRRPIKVESFGDPHAMSATDVVEYAGIRCTSQNLSEWEHGRTMIVVPVPEIQRIDLRHGILAPHPFLLIPFGAILMAIGAIPLIHFLLVSRQGGHVASFEAVVVPFLFIGLYLILTALRRGFYLDVETTRGRFRLRLHKPPKEHLPAFLSTLSMRFGFKVENHAGIAAKP